MELWLLGVVVNSILARSAANNRILDISPEQWLTETYEEINSVFKSFNGSMVISTSFFLIEENSGKTYYFNAEHPFTVLYQDGKATFLDSSLMLRKIGLESEYPFQVFTTILKEGEITDDLSLLRIEYGITLVDQEKSFLSTDKARNDFLKKEVSDWSASYSHARQLYKDGNVKEAIDELAEFYSKTTEGIKVIKLLALLSFKDKDYIKAVEVLGKYLEVDPE